MTPDTLKPPERWVSMARQCCETCRFAGEPMGYSSRHCRRHAPAAVVVMKLHGDYNPCLDLPGTLPVVQATFWCGDWEQRAPQPEDEP